MFNGSDLFGTTLGSFPGELGSVVFADTFPSGIAFAVEFRTASPITLNTYDVYLHEDGLPSPVGSRSVQRFVLEAKTGGSGGYNTVITDTLVTSPYTAYGADTIRISDTFAPVTASEFAAVFYSARGNSGPRVLEMDAWLVPVPEPSTFALLGMGAVGLLGWAWRRRK